MAFIQPKDFVLAEWNKVSPNGSFNVYNEIQSKRQRFHLENDKATPHMQYSKLTCSSIQSLFASYAN